MSEANRAVRFIECNLSLQLRYLQTLNSIAAEHNSTIIFPMPMNILDHFLNRGREKLAEKMS